MGLRLNKGDEHPKMGPDVDTRRAKGFDGKEQAIALDEKAGKIL